MNSETLSLKTIINILDLLKKTATIKWKDLLLLATELIDKLAHPSNAKEYFNSYLKIKTQN